MLNTLHTPLDLQGNKSCNFSKFHMVNIRTAIPRFAQLAQKSRERHRVLRQKLWNISRR